MKPVLSHFPDAQTISSLEKEILDTLQKHNIDPSESIWGTSICSDEVTNIFSGLNKHFAGPGPFRFGGISGLPFTGITGFNAFASHIPTGGHAMILYGPHIGISDDGKTGEILREKQPENTTCCGSLIAALSQIQSGDIPGSLVRNDHQQNHVVKMLSEKHQEITDSENPVKTVTDITYQQIDRELKDIIAASTVVPKNTKILLIGGIVINTDWNKEDYFDLRKSMVIKK